MTYDLHVKLAVFILFSVGVVYCQEYYYENKLYIDTESLVQTGKIVDIANPDDSLNGKPIMMSLFLKTTESAGSDKIIAVNLLTADEKLAATIEIKFASSISWMIKECHKTWQVLSPQPFNKDLPVKYIVLKYAPLEIRQRTAAKGTYYTSDYIFMQFIGPGMQTRQYTVYLFGKDGKDEKEKCPLNPGFFQNLHSKPSKVKFINQGHLTAHVLMSPVRFCDTFPSKLDPNAQPFNKLPILTNETVGFTCSPGYEISDQYMTCISSSDFSGSPPKCAKCRAGFYSKTKDDDPSFNKCVQCENNFISSRSGAPNCTACDPGFTSINANTNCVPCRAGQYRGARDSSCLTCPSQRYSSIEGSPSCDQCPDGFVSNEQQNACDKLPECPPGQHRLPQERNCRICPLNHYNPGAFKACLSCDAGYVNNPQRTGCVPCEAGRYRPPSSTICLACPENQYSIQGAATCSNCAHGNTANSARTGCDPCPAGTFRRNAMLTCGRCSKNQWTGDGAEQCTLCEFGTVSNTQNTGCVSCEEGKIRTQNESDCRPCDPGYEADSSHTSCTPCKPGFYRGQGEKNCKKCQENRISGNAAESCSVCENGNVSNDNKTTCVPPSRCAAGEYGSATTEICNKCAASSYSSEGAVACTICVDGMFSNAGRTRCVPCGPGQYKGVSGSGCRSCPENHYSTYGAEKCTSCGKGRVANQKRSSCTMCEAGQYRGETDRFCMSCPQKTYSDPGSGSCDTCQPGYVSNSGKTACVVCPAGKYSGPRDISCKVCPENHVSSEGSGSCKQCIEGSYANRKRTECGSCMPGEYLRVVGSVSTCKRCPENTYSSSGATRCIPCPQGSVSNEDRSRCEKEKEEPVAVDYEIIDEEDDDEETLIEEESDDDVAVDYEIIDEEDDDEEILIEEESDDEEMSKEKEAQPLRPNPAVDKYKNREVIWEGDMKHGRIFRFRDRIPPPDLKPLEYFDMENYLWLTTIDVYQELRPSPKHSSRDHNPQEGHNNLEKNDSEDYETSDDVVIEIVDIEDKNDMGTLIVDE